MVPKVQQPPLSVLALKKRPELLRNEALV